MEAERSKIFILFTICWYNATLVLQQTGSHAPSSLFAGTFSMHLPAVQIKMMNWPEEEAGVGRLTRRIDQIQTGQSEPAVVAVAQVGSEKLPINNQHSGWLPSSLLLPSVRGSSLWSSNFGSARLNSSSQTTHQLGSAWNTSFLLQVQE